MIACLFPDCDFCSDEPGDGPVTVERQKRVVIDHMNQEHHDPEIVCHVELPCRHDWQNPVTITMTTRDGATGELVDVHVVQERCYRCGQNQQRDAPT